MTRNGGGDGDDDGASQNHHHLEAGLEVDEGAENSPLTTRSSHYGSSSSPGSGTCHLCLTTRQRRRDPSSRRHRRFLGGWKHCCDVSSCSESSESPESSWLARTCLRFPILVVLPWIYVVVSLAFVHKQQHGAWTTGGGGSGWMNPATTCSDSSSSSPATNAASEPNKSPSRLLAFRIKYNYSSLSDTTANNVADDVAGSSDLPITGRVFVCVATVESMKEAGRYLDYPEPRLLVNSGLDTQQIFGADVSELFGGGGDGNDYFRLDATNGVGFPIANLTDVPAPDTGSYWVQAVLKPYVQYNRSDQSSVWLPGFDMYETYMGALMSPGTLLSEPVLVNYDDRNDVEDDGADLTISLTLSKVIPPLPPIEHSPIQSEYLKHVEFKSPMLSEFWGTDVYLKAWVLLPAGYRDHPEVRYPLFVHHTHYERDFSFDFVPDDVPIDENNLHDVYGSYLYRNWTTGELFRGRRGLIVHLQHPNPYYDDSYAVNSQNLGPYGDAITYEFIPYIERQFRGIGEGWARTLYGGSTGGWESFAVQVLYPKEYAGCWSFCPDSLDFHNHQLVNLYDDANAYYVEGEWTSKIYQGSERNNIGQVTGTMEMENHLERALGSQGRSGGQWDIWQAVFGPQDRGTGYPTPIWDKETGAINRTVADFWKNHYDMHEKLKREWHVLGPDLKRKLHVYVGVTDSYYLNGAVYRINEFFSNSSLSPRFEGTIQFGVSADGHGYEHCWTGSYNETISIARKTVNQRFIPQMVDHIVAQAPPGADLSFTSY